MYGYKLKSKKRMSKFAHPITRKVWMYRKRDSHSAEIFEDGLVKYFDETGQWVYDDIYVSQWTAVNELRRNGYRVESGFQIREKLWKI